MTSRSRWRGILLFAGVTFAVAALGGRASRPGLWYRALRKPPLNPPSWVFGPVWSLLYGAIAWSGYRVWQSADSPARTRALVFWSTQLGLNASWSPLFFGAHAPRASLAVVTALVPAIVAYATRARRVDTKAGLLVLPYLAWSTFATYLNAGIVLENRRLLPACKAVIAICSRRRSGASQSPDRPRHLGPSLALHASIATNGGHIP